MNNPAHTHNCATCNIVFVQVSVPSSNNVGFNCFVYGDIGDGSFKMICVECFMKTIKNHAIVQNILETQKNELTYNHAIQISQMEEEILECHKNNLYLKEFSCALNSTLFENEEKEAKKEEQKTNDATVIEVQELRNKVDDWREEKEELRASLDKEKELVKQLNIYIQELQIKIRSQEESLAKFQQEISEPQKNKQQELQIEQIEEPQHQPSPKINVTFQFDNFSNKIEEELKDEPYLKKILEKSKLIVQGRQEFLVESISSLFNEYSNKTVAKIKDAVDLNEIFEKNYLISEELEKSLQDNLNIAFEQYKNKIRETFEKEEEGQVKNAKVCQDMIKKFKDNMDDEEMEGVIDPLEQKVEVAIKNEKKIRKFIDEFFEEKKN